jgi:hypothetical protein
MSRLIDSHAGNPAGSDALSKMMQTRPSAVLPMRELFELAGLAPPADGRLIPSTGKQLTQVLDRLNIALEPEDRYDTWPSTLDDEVVIFKAECGGPINPNRPPYLRARAKIEATMFSAAVDGGDSGERFQLVKNEIAGATEFSSVERARLLAYTFVSLASLPKLRSKMRTGCGNSAPNSRVSLNAKMFPVAGAIALFGSAILLTQLAVRIDHSPSARPLSAADIRRECSFITEHMFHVDCLRRAQQAAGYGGNTVVDSARALPAVQ